MTEMRVSDAAFGAEDDATPSACGDECVNQCHQEITDSERCPSK
jgi:hypothetical protein